MKLSIMFAAILLMGLVGCESEVDRQHHLYNIEQCKAETSAALSGIDFKAEKIDPQAAYRGSVVDCMAHSEHTTSEYQFNKQDDYGTFEPTK